MREGHQPTYDIKRKNEKPREIAEKTAREEYTLDWSQSKVFLVLSYAQKVKSKGYAYAYAVLRNSS